MFSVEMDFDEIKIVVVDESDYYEDLELFIYDDVVMFRQWDEHTQNYIEIGLSVDMFNELTHSLKSEEGVFISRRNKT